MQENKMTWDEITKDVTEAKRAGDPFANIILRLALNKNEAVLMLGDPLDEHIALLPVEIDISGNAYANVRSYYQKKRRDQEKELKTKEASENVLKQAEHEALKQIEKKKAQIAKKNVVARRQFWF
jgi:hypothetical protein